MRKHKYSLTLLEVIIALALTGILMSFLWQAYFNSQKHIAFAEQKKNESLQKVLFQEKISHLLSHLVSEGTEKRLFTMPSKISSFPMFVFEAKLDVDPDPDFSGSVLSALYLTSSRELCLVYWASENKMRSEVLLKDVSSCEFLFFDAQKKEWNHTWPQKNDHLPEMIKINLTQKGQLESYLFFPTQHLGPIIYPKKKTT